MAWVIASWVTPYCAVPRSTGKCQAGYFTVYWIVVIVCAAESRNTSDEKVVLFGGLSVCVISTKLFGGVMCTVHEGFWSRSGFYVDSGPPRILYNQEMGRTSTLCRVR